MDKNPLFQSRKSHGKHRQKLGIDFFKQPMDCKVGKKNSILWHCSRRPSNVVELMDQQAVDPETKTEGPRRRRATS